MKIPGGRPLRVDLDFGSGRVPVGRLVMLRGIAVLEYDAAFLRSGISLDPLAAQPTTGLIAAEPRPFGGIHAMFADSLPDAWGTLLTQRRAAAQGIAYEDLTVLDRLAIVGAHGMGALAYEPETDVILAADAIDLDVLSAESTAILEGAASTVLDALVELGGSSGGARPKVLVGKNAAGGMIAGTRRIPADYEAWLVKFPNSSDREDIGAIEAAYADMARAAGLAVSPTTLLPAKSGPGYFATKRFDRGPVGSRIHFASAAALINVDYERDAIGYEALLQTVRRVTHDQRDVEAAYRRMVFNVLANNRDDHAKQHAFLMSADGVWTLGPAYDLTFSPGPNGEHYLTVNGRGKDISREDLLNVAHAQGIKNAAGIIDEVAQAASTFERFAKTYGVSKSSVTAILSALADVLRVIAK